MNGWSPRVFCDYKARITPTLFKAVAEQTKKNYYNAFIKPAKLNADARLSVIQEPYRQACQKHALVLDLAMEDVNEFFDRFRANIFIQGLAQGNVTEAEAVDLFEALAKKGSNSAVHSCALISLELLSSLNYIILILKKSTLCHPDYKFYNVL